LFVNKNIFRTNTPTSLLSKTLTITQSKLSWADYSVSKYASLTPLTQNILNNTVRFKSINTSSDLNQTTTYNESKYLNVNDVVNFKIKNTTINLSELSKIRNTQNYPLFFNFNLESNLNLSKQQRWLTKNSLLTESITNNSFLITQAKKLIGSGILDKDFTSKTLWLPTKSTKMSSMESSIYFTNLSNQLFKNPTNSSFLSNYNLTHSNFDNLNFFENSRLWLFKKYFFTNNQQLGIIVDSPKSITQLYKQNIYTNNTLITSSNFHLSLYLNQIQLIINNNYTPSLTLNNPNTTAILSFDINKTPTNSINLNTGNLDALRGINSSFIYTLTSNPQQPNNTTNYFSPLLSSPKTPLGSIKFYL
jgi:hypothetical protein